MKEARHRTISQGSDPPSVRETAEGKALAPVHYKEGTETSPPGSTTQDPCDPLPADGANPACPIAGKAMRRMTVSVSLIDPNPGRMLDKYPLNKAKLSAHRESMRTTGVWPVLMARQVGMRFQAAYGHHRIEAIRQEYGPKHEIELLVGDFTDEEMTRLMLAENRNEWRTDAAGHMQMIHGAIDAYAAGQFTLPKPPKKTRKKDLRYAPSVSRGGSSADNADHRFPYTATTLAQGLNLTTESGEPRDEVVVSLQSLELVERGVLTPEIYMDLTLAQASEINALANRRLSWVETESQSKDWAAEAAKAQEEVQALEEQLQLAGVAAEPEARAKVQVELRHAKTRRDYHASMAKVIATAPITACEDASDLRAQLITGSDSSIRARARRRDEQLLEQGTDLHVSYAVHSIKMRLRRATSECPPRLIDDLERLARHQERLPNDERRDLVSSLAMFARQMAAILVRVSEGLTLDEVREEWHLCGYASLPNYVRRLRSDSLDGTQREDASPIPGTSNDSGHQVAIIVCLLDMVEKWITDLSPCVDGTEKMQDSLRLISNVLTDRIQTTSDRLLERIAGVVDHGKASNDDTDDSDGSDTVDQSAPDGVR